MCHLLFGFTSHLSDPWGWNLTCFWCETQTRSKLTTSCSHLPIAILTNINSHTLSLVRFQKSPGRGFCKDRILLIALVTQAGFAFQIFGLTHQAWPYLQFLVGSLHVGLLLFPPLRESFARVAHRTQAGHFIDAYQLVLKMSQRLQMCRQMKVQKAV